MIYIIFNSENTMLIELSLEKDAKKINYKQLFLDIEKQVITINHYFMYKINMNVIKNFYRNGGFFLFFIISEL